MSLGYGKRSVTTGTSPPEHGGGGGIASSISAGLGATVPYIASVRPSSGGGIHYSHPAFSHAQWLIRRNAAVAAHRARVQKAQQQRAETIKKFLLGSAFYNAVPDPLGLLQKAYGYRSRAAEQDLLASLRAGTVSKSLSREGRLLWKIVHGMYPDSGRIPGTRYGTGHDAVALGMVTGKDQGTARIQKALADMATSADASPTERRLLQHVLLHEWAHTRQSPSTFANRIKAEGGAEAFAEHVGKKIGIGAMRRFVPPDYQQFVRIVGRKGGPSWVLSGQFGG